MEPFDIDQYSAFINIFTKDKHNGHVLVLPEILEL